LIEIVPVGARLSTRTETAEEVAALPAASRARAVSACGPSDAWVVFQLDV
jgi:hypothetical protein